MLLKLKTLLNLKLILIAMISTFIISCEPENISDSQQLNSKNQTDLKKADVGQQFYGPTQPMGNGVVRSSVTLTKDGVPSQIALVFSEKALSKLGSESFELMLPLHNKANDLVIDHIALGWNPMGHEPDFLYAIPHFDIHFYWITEEEQMMMTNAKMAAVIPADQYVPMTYFPTDGYVPQMGKHWLSGAADELIPGNIFDKTYIFGSYDGDFIFQEAMITRDYFLGKSFPESTPIFQPQDYAISGYYPTSYSITYDSVKKLYTVSLDNFVWNN
ncbi:hypothetical protein SAMN03097699_0435 [Flavobacteriaceae bacterium MAR_2010_188]|nr:hypothetical protein SAMN03097699_0435 [Flavobacteriaceae bacterium MAR_2010_188]